MTRINCIPVQELVDKHLLAEYRELPRVFGLARLPTPSGVFPTEYTLGTGHVKFFYNKLEYLERRFITIVLELTRRGFKLSYNTLPDKYFTDKNPLLWNDWEPTDEAMQINRDRIHQRLNTMKVMENKNG